MIPKFNQKCIKNQSKINNKSFQNQFKINHLSLPRGSQGLRNQPFWRNPEMCLVRPEFKHFRTVHLKTSFDQKIPKKSNVILFRFYKQKFKISKCSKTMTQKVKIHKNAFQELFLIFPLFFELLR